MTALPILPPPLPPLQDIRLADINFADDSFRMSFEPDLKNLKQSLDAVGLINPLVLRGNPPYQIISGYRRAAAAQQLGWHMIAAHVYPPTGIEDNAALRLAFFENVGTRTFNLIEAGAIVSRFSASDEMVDSSAVQNTMLPLMGFQPSNKILEKLLSLTNLVKQWQAAVIHKGLALANAAKIARLSPEEQTTLFRFLSAIKLGHNKMSQCLDMLEDIQKREGVPLTKIFETGDFEDIITDEQRTITEKTTMFRRCLRERRYPAFTGMEKQFQQARQKLTLPPAVRLDPPPSFEGNRFTLSGSFRSAEELRTIIGALQAAAESEALEEIIKLL